MASEWYNQELALVATIDPVAMTATGSATATAGLWTDPVDMDVFEKCIFIVQAGLIANSSALTFTVYSDPLSATTAMATAVATATALLTADDGEQQILEIDTEDMNPDARDRYLRGHMVLSCPTGSSASAVVGVVALAGHCRYHPASNYDLASVTEISTS